MSGALQRPPLSDADRDERIETFLTPRDWLRYAVGRFLAAGLAFGHGATTALDDAAFLILEGLKLPVDTLDPFLDARLLRRERARLSRSDRSAGDDPQARRLSAEPHLHQGRAVLRRRAGHRPAQPDRRTADDRVRRGQRADRRSSAHRRGARSLHRRRLARHPRRAGVPERAGRRRRSARPTRSKSPGATSRSTGSRNASRSIEGDLFAPAQERPLRPDPRQSALCRRGDDRGVSARISRPSRESPMPAEPTGSTSCAGS